MKISRRSRANISPTDVTTDDDNRTGKERNVTFGSEVDICHSRSRGSGENCFLCREESWLPIFWSTSSPRWRPEYEQIMRTISGILHCRRKINLLSTVSSSVSACSVTYGRHLVDLLCVHPTGVVSQRLVLQVAHGATCRRDLSPSMSRP